MPTRTSSPKTNGGAPSGGVHYADMQTVFDRPAKNGQYILPPSASTRHFQLHIEWKLENDTLKNLFGTGFFHDHFGEALQELAKLEMPEPLRSFLTDCSKRLDPLDPDSGGGKDLGKWTVMVRYEGLKGIGSSSAHPIHPNFDHDDFEMFVDLRYRVDLFANQAQKTRWDDIAGALRHDSVFTAAKLNINTAIGNSGKDDAECALEIVNDLEDE